VSEPLGLESTERQKKCYVQQLAFNIGGHVRRISEIEHIYTRKVLSQDCKSKVVQIRGSVYF
jgi:hypothetical protein